MTKELGKLKKEQEEIIQMHKNELEKVQKTQELEKLEMKMPWKILLNKSKS
jgi:hypothetical protein